jgi:cytochrome c oxidase subunit III
METTKVFNQNPKITLQQGTTLSMHPHKFALWLFVVSITMMFAALTSAYIVKISEGQPLVYDLPQLFWVSSIVIVVSSITMHWGYFSAKKDNLQQTKIAMVITMVLGLVFLVMQIQGWSELVSQNIYFAGSQSKPTGSFVYVFSGLHGVHLLSGLVFVAIILIKTFMGHIHSKSMNAMEMCVTYWHFLDLLWLYLFAFLLLNH